MDAYFSGNPLVELVRDEGAADIGRRVLLRVKAERVGRGTLLCADYSPVVGADVPRLCKVLTAGPAHADLVQSMRCPADRAQYACRHMIPPAMFAQATDQVLQTMERVQRYSMPLEHPIKGGRGRAVSFLLSAAMNHSCCPSAIVVDTCVRFRTEDDEPQPQHQQGDTTSAAEEQTVAGKRKAPLARDDDEGPDDSAGTKLFLYATRDLCRGDEITVSLVPYYLPASKRQMILRADYGIECRCCRCVLGAAWATDALMTQATDGTSFRTAEGRARIDQMKRDYTDLVEDRAQFAQMSDKSADGREQIMSVRCERLIAFLGANAFLHPCHWRVWKVRNLLLENYVVRGQYLNAMLALREQMSALGQVAPDEFCKEKLVLFYRFKWVDGVFQRQDFPSTASATDRVSDVASLMVELFKDHEPFIQHLASMTKTLNTVRAAGGN